VAEAAAGVGPGSHGGEGGGTLTEERIAISVTETIENILSAFPPCAEGHGAMLRGRDDVSRWHESAGLVDLLITAARAKVSYEISPPPSLTLSLSLSLSLLLSLSLSLSCSPSRSPPCQGTCRA